MISNEPLFPVITGEGSGGTGNFQGVLPVAPSNPEEGWTYINSSDNGYYIYYCGAWQLITTLVCVNDLLLLETGDFILKEDGDKIFLED